MRIYSLEGNIGSGKSTLLGKLKEHYAGSARHIFVDEPVAEWVAMKDPADGLNILEKYYADQSRYGFSFQIFAYITKLRRLMDAAKAAASIPGAVLICERSLYTDRYVFAKMLRDMGKIEDINYSIYLNWYDYFINSIDASRHFIYVATSADICDARIRRRNRAGEEGIPIDYLRECEKYHIAMVNELGVGSDENKVTSITLDGNIHKEDGDPWDSELAKVAAFIDGDGAPVATAMAPYELSLHDLLCKYSEEFKHTNNEPPAPLSEEEYIKVLCDQIDRDLSLSHVKQLWEKFMDNDNILFSLTADSYKSDIETEYKYQCCYSSVDAEFEDVFKIIIDVRINEDKYPKYDSYTYNHTHLLASIKNINAGLMAYCTGRNLNCSFNTDDQPRHIIITL